MGHLGNASRLGDKHQENRISVAGRDGVAERGQGDGSGATLSSFDLRRN